MTTISFRKLHADEIECRVGIAKKNGCSLLLYKDARCDMNILDEAGVKWQRRHTRDNTNCIVSIWDEDLKQFLEREDVGTPSKTEEEKGLASDSFKRACFNWGIGRELYTAPFIWIPSSQYENEERNGKFSPKATFKVTEIHYNDKGTIDGLKIVNLQLDRENKLVYSYISPELAKELRNKPSKIIEALKES